jgi:hypothetical protein
MAFWHLLVALLTIIRPDSVSHSLLCDGVLALTGGTADNRQIFQPIFKWWTGKEKEISYLYLNYTKGR